MALGWMTVLKMVPWGDVIKNAPAVADGAKKLWNSVGKSTPKSEPSGVIEAGEVVETESDVQRIVALSAKVSALEHAMADLHQQMRESSELIAALADQNTQLIRRVELNRRLLLGIAGVVFALVLALAVRMASSPLA